MSNQQSTAVTNPERIKLAMDSYAPQVRLALSPAISMDRFKRISLTAMMSNPDLQKCEVNSLMSAWMRAAEDGLLPNKKEAVILAYGNKAEYQAMYQGIVKKMHATGLIGNIMAQVVYEKDPFEYWVDENGEHLKHTPDMLSSSRGRIIAVYAIVTMKDGHRYIEVLTMGDLDKIRNASRAKNSGPWVSWPEEMAKKSAVRRLAKRLPMTEDLEDFFQRDDQSYDFEVKEDKVEAAPKQDGKPNRLNNLMKDKIQKPDVPTETVEENKEDEDQRPV